MGRSPVGQRRLDREPRETYRLTQRIERARGRRVVNSVAQASSRERATDGSTGSSKLVDLYERSGPGSIRLAYLLPGDPAVAEDIAQDAFVRVVGHLGHLRDASAFDSYLRRTVVNLSKNHFRRRAVERRFLALAAEPEPVPSPEGASIESSTYIVDVAAGQTTRVTTGFLPVWLSPDTLIVRI